MPLSSPPMKMDMANCALLFFMFLLAYTSHLAAAFARPGERPPQSTGCLRIRVEQPAAKKEITAKFMLEKNG